jgi:hypothetical protein
MDPTVISQSGVVNVADDVPDDVPEPLPSDDLEDDESPHDTAGTDVLNRAAVDLSNEDDGDDDVTMEAGGDDNEVSPDSSSARRSEVVLPARHQGSGTRAGKRTVAAGEDEPPTREKRSRMSVGSVSAARKSRASRAPSLSQDQVSIPPPFLTKSCCLVRLLSVSILVSL